MGLESESFDINLTIDLTIKMKLWRVNPDLWISNEDLPYRSQEDVEELINSDVCQGIWRPHGINLEIDPVWI